MTNLNKGTNVTIQGRFIPESQMENLSKGVINQGYPQIHAKGKITLITDGRYFVDLEGMEEMEVPLEDILLSVNK